MNKQLILFDAEPSRARGAPVSLNESVKQRLLVLMRSAIIVTYLNAKEVESDEQRNTEQG